MPLPTKKTPSAMATMRADGSRLKMQPLESPGRWLNRRRALFAGLVAFYVLAPFGSLGGHPLLFLDVARRRFWLFGQSFNAQDVWLLLLFALAMGFGLLLVTAWRGRVWCGWACPQTVFLEGIFRPIERLFEGRAEQRVALSAAPWSRNKLLRVGGKHLTFFLVATAIAHAATAIFVSPAELWLMVVEGPLRHLEAFALVTAFSAVLLFNFGWFREQFCVVVCPYGRLQSVLHDRDTVTVAYDSLRGDPRGKVFKAAGLAPPRGDCVDCFKCVRVCPTGIDIRDGLQMDCLACLQCVDACDSVMAKLHRPQGLIRLTSQRELDKQPRQVLRPRTLVYGLLFTLCSTALGASLMVRMPFEANVLRPRGAVPFALDGSIIRNAFEVHLVNKHPDAASFHISVTAPPEAHVVIGTPALRLEALEDARVPVSVSLAREKIGGPVELTLAIADLASGEVQRTPVQFLAPMQAAQ